MSDLSLPLDAPATRAVRPPRRVHAVALWAVGVSAAVALGVALVVAFGTLTYRPLDVVEGEILFETQRLRAHLPLYVDPVLGARDYGSVPSHYYVLYTPLWPWILSTLPGPWAEDVARLTSAVSWFGLLGWVA